MDNGTDYIWIAFIVGTAIAASGFVTLAVCRLMLKARREGFAEGQSSVWRNKEDLPPVHIEGEEPDDTHVGVMVDGDELVIPGDYDQGQEVRVNFSGPRKQRPE